MRAAAGEDALVVIDRAGERALAVAEQLDSINVSGNCDRLMAMKLSAKLAAKR